MIQIKDAFADGIRVERLGEFCAVAITDGRITPVGSLGRHTADGDGAESSYVFTSLVHDKNPLG
jgi:hypothetical protein